MFCGISTSLRLETSEPCSIFSFFVRFIDISFASWESTQLQRLIYYPKSVCVYVSEQVLFNVLWWNYNLLIWIVMVWLMNQSSGAFLVQANSLSAITSSLVEILFSLFLYNIIKSTSRYIVHLKIPMIGSRDHALKKDKCALKLMKKKYYSEISFHADTPA